MMKRRTGTRAPRTSVTMRVSRRALATLSELRTTRIGRGVPLSELRQGRLVEEALELLREKEHL